MASWIAAELELEERIVPLLNYAYRLSPVRQYRNALPRDILVQFIHFRAHHKILAEARHKDFLGKRECKIFDSKI